MRFRQLPWWVGLLAGLAGPLQAQTSPQPGNPLDQLPAPSPIPSRGAPPPRVDVQTPAGAAAGRLDRRIAVTRVDLEGVAALPFAEVAGFFSPFVRQEATVAQLVAAAREATARYRERGYPLSFAYLPAQDFEGGVVRVVAVEGHIAGVRIEGDAGPSTDRLRAIAERLQRERPLRLASFERITQLLTRLPGLTVTAEASMPATTDGATTLVLKVRRQPYNVSLGADLRQPRSRAVLSGVLNDPFLPGGELSASTLVGDFRREKLLTLGYTQLVGTDGLAWKTTFSNYRGYPDAQAGRDADVSRFNTNRRFETSASYPLLLDARRNLSVSGGFYAVDNADDYRARATGARLTEDTRVRALFTQLAYTETEAARSRNASVLLARGLDGLGASAENRSNVPGLSGPGSAKLDFTRIALDAAQRDRYANHWGTALLFGAQYSPDSLPASERVSFGGTRFGRGYAPADGAGDKGWGVGAEVNRAFAFDGAWLKQIEPYLLLEAAEVSTRIGRPSPAKLRSVALGLRLSDSRYYSVDVALAKPTGDAAPTNPERKVRVSLLLSYQLDPR